MTYDDLTKFKDYNCFNLINGSDLLFGLQMEWFDIRYEWDKPWQYCLLYYLSVYDYYNGLNLNMRKAYLKSMLGKSKMFELNVEIFKDKNITNDLIKYIESSKFDKYLFGSLLEKYKC